MNGIMSSRYAYRMSSRYVLDRDLYYLMVRNHKLPKDVSVEIIREHLYRLIPVVARRENQSAGVGRPGIAEEIDGKPRGQPAHSASITVQEINVAVGVAFSEEQKFAVRRPLREVEI